MKVLLNQEYELPSWYVQTSAGLTYRVNRYAKKFYFIFRRALLRHYYFKQAFIYNKQ